MNFKTLLLVMVSLLISAVPVWSEGMDLNYSTYLGGTNGDYGQGIAVEDGEIGIAGFTASPDFPTMNPYQDTYGGGDNDAFVSRLSSSGDLTFSTYFGGDSYDPGYGVALENGEMFIAGYTGSANFPTENPYQVNFGGGDADAFVARFSSLNTLSFSTYLGGNRDDWNKKIAVESGVIVIAGNSDSLNFPVVNPYQATHISVYDAFVSRFNSAGDLTFSTYLGGNSDDYARGIAMENGEIIVGGYTKSSNFPMVDPYQGVFGGGTRDVFVSRFNSAGDLTFSTYLGGASDDRSYSLAVENGEIVISGYTESTNFPTLNPFQSVFGGGSDDAFCSRFSSSGNLTFSTYLGGSESDHARGVAVENGETVIVGHTNSSDFPTLDPYQAAYRDPFNSHYYTVFATRFNSLGEVTFSTYLGGSGEDRAYGVAMENRQIFITGWTTYTDFPIVAAWQSEFGGYVDAFIACFSPSIVPTTPPWIYDYNGDGTSDIAIFRPGSGLWAVRGITRVYFGSSTDETVPGDYDGDGTTDIGIFRISSGLWAIRDVTRAYFGGGSDLPEPGDYDGDGTADIGLFRPASGLWAIRGVTRAYFGGSSDEPIPGYYDADGSKDIGLFRPASGLWAIRGVTRIYFGGSTDEPIPGDYNGDGVWVAGIFRPSSGLWAVSGVTRSYFGGSTDWPLPADYSGNGRDDIGIFRGTSGLWAVKGVTRVYFGGASDIPVTR